MSFAGAERLRAGYQPKPRQGGRLVLPPGVAILNEGEVLVPAPRAHVPPRPIPAPPLPERICPYCQSVHADVVKCP